MSIPYTSSCYSSISGYPSNVPLSSSIDRSSGIFYLGLLFSTLLLLSTFSINTSAGEGDLLWTYGTSGAVRSSPAIGSDGTIFIGSDDDTIYALEPGESPDTRVNWTYTTGGDVVSAPTVGGDGMVYVGSSDGNLYALDSSSGTKKWQFSTAGPVKSSRRTSR